MYRSVLASILLSLVFSGLFVADLQGYFNRASEPIAVLQSADGTVRRLGLNQLTWDRALMGTLFGAGDTISTGEGGRARLVFYAGGEVLLDEGAMLVLGGGTEELQLNFLSGSGRVRVAKDATQKITVAQGAPAARAGRKPAAAPPARPAQAPAIARVQVEEVEKVEVPPPPVASAPAEPSATVASAAPDKSPTEAAAEREFTTAIQEDKIRETAQVLSTGGEIASVAKLPPVPEIVFPSKDAVFDLTTGSVPKLEWKVADAQDKAMSFEIILRPAGTPEEEVDEDDVKVLRSRVPELALSRVQHGKYFWSVRAVAADGSRSPATQARFMEVIVPARIERPRVLPVKIE